MKSFLPPTWQIPGLLDGSVSVVSWPMKPQPVQDSNGNWIIPVGSQEKQPRTENDPPYGIGRAAWLTKAPWQPGDVLAGKEALYERPTRKRASS